MGQARDDAGNVWETDAQGNAVRLVQPAAHARLGTIMTNPYKPREEQRADTSLAISEGNLTLSKGREAREAENQTKGTLPTGFRWADAAHTKQEIIPGGPADTSDALDPATLTYYAQQVLAGVPIPAIGTGRQAAATRQAIMSEVARLAGAAGLTGADQARQIAHYKAGSGQIANLEKMAGAIGVNEQTALANGQQFLDRSAELPGQTRFSPVNAISDWIQRRFGGTTISAMDAAHTTFANEYAKVVAGSPTGAGVLSDSARREAMDTIQSNASLDQKQRAFDQMKTDMANRMIAIHGGINEAYKALTSQPGYQVPDATQGLARPGSKQSSVSGGASPFTGNGGGTTPAGGSPFGPDGGGAAPNQPGLAPGGSGRTFYTNRDQALADESQKAFATGASRQQMDAIAAKYGHGPYGPDLDKAIEQRNRTGFVGYQFPAMPTGREETGLTGTLANAIPSNTASFVGGAADALTLGQMGHIAELTGSSKGGTEIADNMLQANGLPYVVGEMAGSILPTMGIGRGLRAGAAIVENPFAKAILGSPIAADAAYGAVYGAGTSDDPIRGAVVGGALGGAGSFVGSKIGAKAASMRNSGVAEALSRGETSVLNAVNKTGRDAVVDALTNADRLGVPATLADVSPEVGALTGAAIRRSPTVAGQARDTLLPRGRGQIDRFKTAVERDLGPATNISQTSADLGRQAAADAAPLYAKAFEGGSIAPLEHQFQSAFQESSGAVARAQQDLTHARNALTLSKAGVSRAGDNVYAANGALRTDRGAADAVTTAEQNLATAQATHDGNLARLRQAQADGSAGKKGAIWSPRIQQFLDDPISKAGLARGYEVQRLESLAAGKPFDPSEMAITGFDEAGNPIVAAVPNMRTLDAVKRGFDEILSDYPRSPGGQLQLDQRGRAVDQVRRSLLGHLDVLNPDYSAARAAWGGPMASRDALTRGRDFYNEAPDVVGMAMQGQSPEHVAQMQLGHRSQMMNQAENYRSSANPFEGVLGTPAAEKRLAAIYPDQPDSVANLLAQRDWERQLSGTTNRLIGNSFTANNQIADAAFEANPIVEGALHAGAAVVSHGASLPVTAARIARSGVVSRAREALSSRAIAKAEQIGPITLNPSPQESIASLLAMEQKRQDDIVARALMAAGGARRGGQIGSSVADALVPYATAD